MKTALVLMAALLLLGCGTSASESASSASVAESSDKSKEGDKKYTVRGRFRAATGNGQAAKIHHEDVPGWMDAMSMDFRFQEPSQLEGLKAGDAVEFELVVEPQGLFYITQLKKLPAGTQLSID